MRITVFWPEGVQSNGVCYGWTSPAICVAGVLDTDDEIDAAARVSAAAQREEWTPYGASCASAPKILGTCCFPGESTGTSAPILKLSMDILASLELHDVSIDHVYYTRFSPSSMRFYCLERSPAEDLVHERRKNVRYGVLNVRPGHRLEASSTGNITPALLHQFNSAQAFETLLVKCERAGPAPSVMLRGHDLISAVCHAVFQINLQLRALLHRFCTIPVCLSTPSLVVSSATAFQMSIRIEQAMSLAKQWRMLDRKEHDSTMKFCWMYNHFYNQIWLIANDIIIGQAIKSLILNNSETIIYHLNALIKTIVVDWVQISVFWLSQWPAGLKLNTELSMFFSNFFSYSILQWTYILDKNTFVLRLFVACIGQLSICGATFTFTMISDLLSIVTLHLNLCYYVCLQNYSISQCILKTLWRLFQGQQFNLIRMKPDIRNYDLDQLIFGTMFFVLLTFIFPTILTYYILFALIKFIIVLLQIATRFLIIVINEFPLFYIMLLIKDKQRLSYGVQCKIVINKDTANIFILSQSLALNQVFSGFLKIVELLVDLKALVKAFAVGEYLTVHGLEN